MILVTGVWATSAPTPVFRSRMPGKRSRFWTISAIRKPACYSACGDLSKLRQIREGRHPRQSNPLATIRHLSNKCRHALRWPESRGESTKSPISYYDNNIGGTLCLLEAMTTAGVKTLVFSSSATVYGDSCNVPIPEESLRSATNPYGRSKLFIEDILADLHSSDDQWRIARLRYFNPVGAHESARIGEDPVGIPANLMPYIAQVAVGHRERLNVFGGDYPTRDGTGVRDYVHVMDLAEGHVAALRALQRQGGMLTVNLGTGSGTSVLEIIDAFSRVSHRDIPYQIVERRPGDVAQCYAAVAHAERVLEWKAKRNLADMCADHWRWQVENPNGYPQS